MHEFLRNIAMWCVSHLKPASAPAPAIVPNEARRIELSSSIIESVKSSPKLNSAAVKIAAPPVERKPHLTRKRIDQLDSEEPGWRFPAEKNRLKQLLNASPAIVDRFCLLQELVDNSSTTDEVRVKARRYWNSALRKFLVKAKASEPELDPALVEKVIYHGLAKIWLERRNELRRLGLIYTDTMTPNEYEHFCARLLSAKGWQAAATKACGDQGVDVVARWQDRCLVIQAKKYASPVGNAAVQEIYAGMAHYQADRGIVVSTAGFTKSARELANSTGVLLLHHEELAAISPWSLPQANQRL